MNQGGQIYLGTTYQNGKIIPNDHRMYKSFWPKNRQNGHKIQTSSIVGPSKIYPNLFFWFENYHLAALI
jgi:hypothetical protein